VCVLRQNACVCERVCVCVQYLFRAPTKLNSLLGRATPTQRASTRRAHEHYLGPVVPDPTTSPASGVVYCSKSCGQTQRTGTTSNGRASHVAAAYPVCTTFLENKWAGVPSSGIRLSHTRRGVWARRDTHTPSFVGENVSEPGVVVIIVQLHAPLGALYVHDRAGVVAAGVWPIDFESVPHTHVRGIQFRLRAPRCIYKSGCGVVAREKVRARAYLAR
jgi:hypothetical protein